jgi:hypothetical protein
MANWVVYWTGRHQNRGIVKTSQRKTTFTKEGTTDECVEVGLIEGLMEKQLENQ